MKSDEHTIQEFMLDVGNDHRIYVQQWGAVDVKKPVLYLHGGPGSGCSDSVKTLFDPSLHQVIFFDQRGSGRSTPSGSLKNNRTSDLVEDIQKIISKLKIQKFYILGGSWGSCLALVYALNYPQNIERMLIRGIFTARKSEIDYLSQENVFKFYPDVWEEFTDTVPSTRKDDPVLFHMQKILENGEDAKQSAVCYFRFEKALSGLNGIENLDKIENLDLSPTRIHAHYLTNSCFLQEGSILKNASRLKMPIDIVQGRYDMVCIPSTAYELYKQLSNATITWTVAGHSWQDEKTFHVLKDLLSKEYSSI